MGELDLQIATNKKQSGYALLKKASVLFLFLLAAALFWGAFRFPRAPLYIELTTARILALAALSLVVPFLLKSKMKSDKNFALFLLAGFIFTYIFSDLPFRVHSFIQPGIYLYEISGAFLVAIITLLIIPQRWPMILLATTIGFALGGFIGVSEGRLLFSDDHPSFLYRLIQLKENFPHIPFYNPMWNGGVEAREFFPSGILSVYFIFWPIIQFADLVASYNYIIAVLFFLLPPLVMFLSSRVLGFSKEQSFLSAILSLTTSFIWYRWALHFGTLGFITSSILLPLAVSLSARLIEDKEKKPILIAALLIVVSLIMFWTPAILFLLPVGLLVAIALVKQRQKRVLAVLLVLMTVFHAPWLTVFTKSSKVTQFFNVDSEPMLQSDTVSHQEDVRLKVATEDESWIAQIKFNLREFGTSANPLVIFGGIAGLIFSLTGVARLYYVVTATWLLLFGVFGPVFKPQLELERSLMTFLMVLTVPAGAVAYELFKERTKLLFFIAKTIVLAFLVLSPYWIYRIVTKQAQLGYEFADNTVSDLTSILRQRATTGRAMFAGFTLHELSTGHVAPLAAFANAPLVASRYQHDRWQYTDVIPKYYRSRKFEGVIEYLDLMNVSTVITHDKFWRRWYEKYPKYFKKIARTGRFTVFERLYYVGSYVYSGKAEILEQRGSSLVVQAQSAEVVLKFKFRESLHASNCALSAFAMQGGFELVKLTDCGQERTIIE